MKKKPEDEVFLLSKPSLIYFSKTTPLLLSARNTNNFRLYFLYIFQDENIYEVPDELYAVNVTSVTRETCEELYEADGFKDTIKTDMICFLDFGKDSCQVGVQHRTRVVKNITSFRLKNNILIDLFFQTFDLLLDYLQKCFYIVSV